MKKKTRLVCGVGVNDYIGSISLNSHHIKSYMSWKNMLIRCYSAKYQINKPTYIGCSVCDEWLYFTNFKKWHDANYKEGFELDKDILFQGNKIYSPANCCFIPNYLNAILNDHGNARGELPLGITKNNNSYRSQCGDGYGKQLNKSFRTLEKASSWYSVTKTRVIAEQVQRALSEGSIDQRIANALLQRRF